MNTFDNRRHPMTPNVIEPVPFDESADFEPVPAEHPGAFYLQDSRQIVGNDMMFWALGGGYTSDVSKAEAFNLDEAQRQHNCRETDIPWPKEYIDAKTRPAVDVQYVRRDEALEGSGITLVEPKKPATLRYRCGQCGAFVTQMQYYTECPKCEGSNAP